jgi:hypothetical protein
VLGLATVAVIHMAQIVPTTKQTPWLGVAFIALALACTALAGRLLHRGDPLLWAQVGVLNLLVIGGYIFTRLLSTPLDNQDVGNWSETLGVTSIFVEGLLVLLSAHAMLGRPVPRATRSLAGQPDSLTRQPVASRWR